MFISYHPEMKLVYLFSKYGMDVVCSKTYTYCTVLVSGFYHGRLRGLLGDGNNEHYDDYTLPSGKVSPQFQCMFYSVLSANKLLACNNKRDNRENKKEKPIP